MIPIALFDLGLGTFLHPVIPVYLAWQTLSAGGPAGSLAFSAGILCLYAGLAALMVAWLLSRRGVAIRILLHTAIVMCCALGLLWLCLVGIAFS